MAQAKEVRGPGPRMGGPRPKVENPGKLLKRIMDEVFRHYLPHCILVLVCIVVSALANVQASLFLKTLMDDYIVPMTQQQDPDFAPLAAALLRVGIIYVIGILAAWGNARIMVNVTQGTLRNLRTQLFTHMESLPIKYFDQHPHGDIMSVYTNDVDTLRQMLSQSIPQLVSSAITIVSVFFSMCMLSWQLTIVTMLMVALMMFCSKKITQQSGKYFIQQQRDLGKLNGYIEEMMEGQKVVKVFTHEQKALEGFRELNDKLKDLSLIHILERKGYITRQSVEQDARLKQLVLTEKGRQFHEDTMRAFHQTDEDVYKRQLRAFLTALAASVLSLMCS